MHLNLVSLPRQQRTVPQIQGVETFSVDLSIHYDCNRQLFIFMSVSRLAARLFTSAGQVRDTHCCHLALILHEMIDILILPGGDLAQQCPCNNSEERPSSRHASGAAQVARSSCSFHSRQQQLDYLLTRGAALRPQRTTGVYFVGVS